MKSIKFMLFSIIIQVFFTGCASHKSYYEAPLNDVSMISRKVEGDPWRLDEIPYDGIDNAKPGERPPLDSDEAGLWMVMDQAEERLSTSGHLIHDEALNRYLHDIACRLTPEYCEDLRIYVLRVPYFNAAMMPKGAMQIWSGLLVRVQNEAQLASIIGHEVGHYIRRHSLQQMQGMINKTSTLVFVQVATALAGVGIAGDVATLITAGSIAAFSRDQEREADGYGLALLSRAGYDPREAAKVWEQLLEEDKVSENKRSQPIFLSTHPLPAERLYALKDLGNRIAAKGADYKTEKARLAENILPKQKDWLKDEFYLCDYARTEKLLDTLLENEKSNADLLYLKGELYRLRGKEGDIDKALSVYENARAAGSPPSEIYRSMGLLYSKSGRTAEAIASFQAYLENCADCSDSQMITHMIEGMKNGK